MKYVIAFNPVSQALYPTVFPDEVTHANIGLVQNKAERLRIRSAGFVYFSDGKWTVPDTPSISLKIGPKEGDELILRLFLGQGLCGLELQNMMAYLQIEAKKQKGK